MNDSFGEKPSGRQPVGGLKQLRAVALGPEVKPAGSLKPVRQDFDLLVGADREEVGGFFDGLPGALELGNCGFEFGSLSHLVDMSLAAEAGFEELLAFLGLHTLPLPL